MLRSNHIGCKPPLEPAREPWNTKDTQLLWAFHHSIGQANMSAITIAIYGPGCLNQWR